MRHLHLGLMLLAGAAAPQLSARPASPSERQRLLAVEARWNKAISDRDAAIAGAIISDDFRYVTPTGKVLDRTAVLKATADPDYKIDPFHTEEVEVRIHGNSAVVTGRFAQSGSYKGERFNIQLRYTDMWVKRGANWQAVSAHSSVIR
jgi:ketosteroid isomerase-like protein